MIPNEKIDNYIAKLSNLQKLELIPEDELIELCEQVKEVLITEPNLILLEAPVNVVGDIHGQHHDMLNMFVKGGKVGENKYLFMGDYVDRGYFSLETIELLLCYKLKYQKQIYLLRGNHESRMITAAYGFKDEISKKYGNNSIWQTFMEVFDLLPLAGLISGKIFCVHAGLSRDIKKLYQINLIDRNKEVDSSGKFADLLWSDPNEEYGGFKPNQRGAGTLFGEDVVEEFCKRNGLTMILRSHQLAELGYNYPFSVKNKKPDEEQKLMTVWSVPNYCYRCNNKAIIIKVDANCKMEKVLFEHNPDGAKTPIAKMMPYFL